MGINSFMQKPRYGQIPFRGSAYGEVSRMEDHDFVKGSRDACTVAEAGGKGFNLSRLAQAGFNVPEFFIITTHAFERFMAGNGMDPRTATEDSITKGIFPEDLAMEIMRSYESKLNGMHIAVRSSATLEDAEGESRAGRYRTVLSADRTNLLNAVKEVYRSMFTSGRDSSDRMAVVVQRQIEPQKAGVAFADREKTVINGILGQGEVLVSGKESGDTYLVENGSVRGRNIKLQSTMSRDGVNSVSVPPVISSKQKLSEYEILQIHSMAAKVLKQFGRPQDIEWCIKGNEAFVLQARPITKPFDAGMFAAKGGYLPVSRGSGTGKIWFDVKEMPSEDIILVTGYADQVDLEKLLETGHLKGLITDTGGTLSHEGILARERGLPYLAGFPAPQRVFTKGSMLTLDTADLSAKMDGKEMISSEAESYVWLNKDAHGLRVIKLKSKPGGLIIRDLKDFVVVYGTPADSSLIDEIKSIPGNASKTVLADPNYTTLNSLHLLTLNAMFSGPMASHMKEMIDAVDRFDSDAFSNAYSGVLELINEQLSKANEAYFAYGRSGSKNSLESAFASLIRANGYYKGTYIVADYFDYALGSFVSKQEEHTVTDIELYRLKAAYEERYPQITKIERLIAQKIEELDRTLPIFGSSSLEELFNSVLPEAEKTLEKNKFFEILLNIN